jgi:hypothetical protein
VLGLVPDESVRLLTLTGPRGSGKTRLAVQAAAEPVEEHEGGVWWVGLQAWGTAATARPQARARPRVIRGLDPELVAAALLTRRQAGV